MEQDVNIGPTVLSAPGNVDILTEGASTVSINLASISSPSGFSYTIEGSIDGSNFWPAAAFDPSTLATFTRAAQTATSGQWVVPCAGLAKVRFALTAIAAGDAIITMTASQGTVLTMIAGGAVNVLPSYVHLSPATTGGLNNTSYILPNNTTANVVKNTPGQIYQIVTYNNGGTPAYMKIYDATTATAGAGTPDDRIGIPPGANETTWENGVSYGTGITFIVTTGIADADTTAPAASTFIVDVYWK